MDPAPAHAAAPPPAAPPPPGSATARTPPVPDDELPVEHDGRYRPYVPPGAPDFLDRRLASWLVPTLVATARRLQAAGADLLPPEAHRSLALAVLEAVWTPRVDAATTARVVDRFRAEHPEDAGADVLVEAVRGAGGDEAWARACATSHRVLPSLDAPLKATAAREGAQLLCDHGLRDARDLLDLLDAARAAPDPAAQDPETFPTAAEDLSRDPALRAARERWDAVRSAWRTLPGQGSGRSWHRLLVLAGAERVVPDDDVRRFVSRWRRGQELRWRPGTGTPRASTVPDVWVSARLLELAGDLAQVPARAVDHLAWRSELLRGLPGGRTAPGGVSSAAAPP
ncbi:hypothetical protein WDZ17_11350 [Pseudokineococcus basanitobsidens]|uniref:Uncharacterized protein n=1 Tax=Pseudokineococcus basanitobsidens TaxID=1926649 RepID=A0ABU8RLD0_9ACTN